MADYGFEVYAEDGVTKLLETDKIGYMLVDVWVAPSGADKTVEYPELAGYTLAATSVGHERSSGHMIIVGEDHVTAEGLIYPSIFQVRQCDSTVYVFAR